VVSVLAAGVGATALFLFMPQDVIRKKDISNAFAQLRDDVGALYRAARPEAPPLHEDPDDRPRLKDGDARAGAEDLKNELHQTRKAIADLVRESVESRDRGKEEPLLERSFSFTRSGENAEWKASPRTICETLLVTNEGPSIAKDVRVLIDGKSIASTLREIAERAVQGLVDEKQKAIALWRAVVDGRRHDWPAHKEAEDPVKLLGVYGYGFCSHAAHALAALAREAGMKARVLHVRGKHLVTEIMVDGKWAVFDADAETHYPMPDGSLASAEDLRLNPALVSASPSKIYSEAKLRDFYGSPDLVESKPKDTAQPHSLHLALRPGESIEYSRARKGLFFSSRYLDEPREYANGEWSFRPSLADQTWMQGCTRSQIFVPSETALASGFSPPKSPAQPCICHTSSICLILLWMGKLSWKPRASGLLRKSPATDQRGRRSRFGLRERTFGFSLFPTTCTAFTDHRTTDSILV